MLQNNIKVVYLHCVFHGIRFKVGRLEVERLPSFFVLVPILLGSLSINGCKIHKGKCLSIKPINSYILINFQLIQGGSKAIWDNCLPRFEIATIPKQKLTHDS